MDASIGIAQFRTAASLPRCAERCNPVKSGDYSSKTTDSHRELFVKIFEFYTEVDFHDYDYTVAIMPRIGNTAFGECEDIAIPYPRLGPQRGGGLFEI